MPLQIGAPDVAFPRLNAFSFWAFFFGSLIAVGGFLTPQEAASFGWFGWFAYQPLASTTFLPGAGRCSPRRSVRPYLPVAHL